MLPLLLKKAETALADGRLDDAYSIVRQQTVKDHRRGQSLITRLVREFVKRADSHLQADRIEFADKDCQRALELGGNQNDIGELVAHIRDAHAEIKANQQKKNRSWQQAIKLADAGDFSAGRRVCSQLSTQSANLVEDQICQKESKLNRSMETIQRLIQAGQFELALPEILAAQKLQRDNPAINEYAQVVAEKMRDEIWHHFDNGRFDQALSQLARLRILPDPISALDEAVRLADRVVSAAKKLKERDFLGLQSELSVLQQILPNADWIEEAKAQSKFAADAEFQLMSGPLALAFDAKKNSSIPVESTVTPSLNVAPFEKQNAIDFEDFLLHIDGSSTVLVLTSAEVSFGPNRAVNLVGGANSPIVYMERVEDDYFVRGDTPIQVNEKRYSSKLLSNGDRVDLSSRHGLRFQMPCPASTSATIDLLGVRHVRPEIRRVVLMDNALVIANHSACHIQARPISEPYVLFIRKHQLMARAMEQPKEAICLHPGQSTKLGNVHIVWKPC